MCSNVKKTSNLLQKRMQVRGGGGGGGGGATGKSTELQNDLMCYTKMLFYRSMLHLKNATINYID